MIDRADDTIFAPSAVVTTDLEDVVDGNAIQANEPVISRTITPTCPPADLQKKCRHSANIWRHSNDESGATSHRSARISAARRV